MIEALEIFAATNPTAAYGGLGLAAVVILGAGIWLAYQAGRDTGRTEATQDCFSISNRRYRRVKREMRRG